MTSCTRKLIIYTPVNLRSTFSLPVLALTSQDIQEKNILLGIGDLSILDDFEKQERESPVPRKIDGDRVIYESRSLDNTRDPGRPVLTDFGEARLGSTTYTGLIQPSQYRAPEVLLEMPWDSKVDIWNVGVMVSSFPISLPFS